MSKFILRAGAIVFASVLALAPLAATPAAARGMGGGGGHIGGGGFGGGFRGGGGFGGHVGGGFDGMRSFGGGGMRSIGGPVGGPAHIGGSGMRSFGGSRPLVIQRNPAFRSVGGQHFIGQNRRIGVTRLGPGGRSVGLGTTLHGSRQIGTTFRGNRLVGTAPFASRTVGGWQRFSSAHTFNTAPVFRAGRPLAGAWFARRHWRRFGYFGWVGPVFWPYAYDDIFYDAFWLYGYDDPFWYYGYPDLYAGLFLPYPVDDLDGWYAPAPRSRVAHARATAQPAEMAAASRLTPICGDDAREVTVMPIERIQATVKPNADQRALLDALGTASVQAAQTIKAACPAATPLSAPARVDVMEKRIEAMRQAVAGLQAPLDAFYGALDDAQKKRFDAMARREDTGTKSCGASSANVPDWPSEQIEKRVQPSEAQRAGFTTLKDTTARAAESIKASCPGELPATPPARLAAIGKRLDAMHEAVKSVHGALDSVYGTLNDEQKAQFNAIGQPKARPQG